MLTLYYASATFLQAWRIKSACNKIAEQLALQASISFYALPAATDDGYDITLATSDRCSNRSAAKVTEILWLHGNQRGCCVQPVQSVPITPWISFPREQPIWLPFAHLHTPEEVVSQLTGRQDLLHLLLEVDTQPFYADGRNEDIVRIEDYGKLIAWKIDSHLAVLLETDIELFTKLLITTFLQNNLLINDQLPLIRIESIHYEGQPQPFELVSNHLRKCTRATAELSEEEWHKHLEDLRALSVRASQATEFEQNKNRTEGKTGVIKPDLIPLEKKQQAAAAAAATASAAAEASANKLTTATKTVEPEVLVKQGESLSSSSSSNSIAAQTTKVLKAEAAATTKTVAANSSNAPLLGKTKTKPTEIRKPGSSAASKLFSVSPEKSTSQATTAVAPQVKTTPVKASKLEKIATTTVTAQQQPSAPQESATKTASITEPSTAATVQPAVNTVVIKPIVTTSTSHTLPATTVTTASVSTVTATKPPSAPATVATVTPTVATAATVTPIVATVAPTVATVTPTVDTVTPTVDTVTPTVATVTPTVATAVAASPTPKSTPIKISSAAVTNGSASAVSVSKNNTKRPSLRRNKDSLQDSKPLNVLVYSDSASARESAVATLKDILETDMYTIYPLTPQQVQEKHWLDHTALVVVCGAVPPSIGEILVDYFLRGGKVLSLCSDILHFILPTYRTAEVREHELVQFSYDKWQRVKMMHHIFCYQPSPVKKNFSTDSDDATQSLTRKPALVCPRSIELKDLHGELHNLDVKVLGTEETWNTPSLLLANSVKSGGKAVFSQVHLETPPSQFETDEAKYKVLKQNEQIRLEIFSDLLNKHLQVDVKHASAMADNTKKCVYKNAYFLGRYESKAELLEKLKQQTGTDKKLTTSKLIMKFCGVNDTPLHANTNVLPILIHSCPDDFSTVEYFDDLKTREIGRLLIYAPIVSSSMNVISELELVHGIAVLARQQTEGVGRSNNQWLSPIGCAMFSLQLHISMETPLGARLPLIQHIIGAALVNALRSHAIYRILDIGLKWPNDIYANGLIKIGGLIVKTTLLGTKAIVNVGCGINLDNAKPTHCINDLISEYNRANHQNLPLIKYEQLIALMFNEIEKLIDEVQTTDFENFYKLYYELWLHNDQTVTVSHGDGTKRDAKVVGIDDHGYLKVKFASGDTETVQPDGNSFDMLKGLIAPKLN